MQPEPGQFLPPPGRPASAAKSQMPQHGIRTSPRDEEEELDRDSIFSSLWEETRASGRSRRWATQAELRRLRQHLPELLDALLDAMPQQVEDWEIQSMCNTASAAGARWVWTVAETGAAAEEDGAWLEWSEPVRLYPGHSPVTGVPKHAQSLALLFSKEKPKPASTEDGPGHGETGDRASQGLAAHEVEPAIQVEREEMGARLPRVKRAPLAPSARQRALHNLTHTRFKSWCRACVSGRGRRSPHVTRSREGEVRGHEVSADF